MSDCLTSMTLENGLNVHCDILTLESAQEKLSHSLLCLGTGVAVQDTHRYCS
jgi:hypothetical protein